VVAPVAFEYVPAGHNVGVELFLGQYRPVGHTAQVDTAVALVAPE